MKKSRKHRQDEGGFALLVVVLLVALVGVSGVALLDMVQVDLNIVGQQRKTTRAQTVAVGGMLELLSDTQVGNAANLAQPQPGQTMIRYVGTNAGTLMRFPDGPPTPEALTPSNSAVAANLGTRLEDSYEADISYLRAVPLEDTSLQRVVAIVYEARVASRVYDGEASSEIRSEFFRPVTLSQGYQIPNISQR